MEQKEDNPTCEQRIDEKLKSRLEELLPDVTGWGVLKCARMLKDEGRRLRTADLKDLQVEVQETIQQRAVQDLLCIQKTITFTACLSWGGPADYFELDWCPDSQEWQGGRYVFQDWFDGATRNISQEQAEELAQLFRIYPDK